MTAWSAADSTALKVQLIDAGTAPTDGAGGWQRFESARPVPAFRLRARRPQAFATATHLGEAEPVSPFAQGVHPEHPGFSGYPKP